MKTSKQILIFLLLISTLTKAQVNEKFHTNYDTTKSAFRNYYSGFANVFYEYSDTFRIRGKDIGEESPMILEKLSNKEWTFVDSFDYSYTFSHSIVDDVKEEDYNNDGVEDFIVKYGKWSDIKLVFI